jgi:hypothetical protein
MADRDRRNQDDTDDTPDKTPRPLTPGQREAHRRDAAEQARDAQLDAHRAQEAAYRAQQIREGERRQAEAQREQAAAAQVPAPVQASVVDAPHVEQPALAAMTLSEMYDALDATATNLDAVVERVRAAIRSQAADYQELACRLVMAPQVTFALRKEGNDA